MSAPSDGARADARKRLVESRCWAIVAGNPCEGRAGHEGAHTALSMAGAWLYATAAPQADEVDDATSLGLLIFEDAQVGGTRKIVERILASDWLAGVIADAKAEGARAVLEAVKGDSKYGTPQQIIANMLYAARAATARFEVQR